MKSPFDDALVNTTLTMPAVGVPMNRNSKELRQEQLLTQLKMWPLAESKEPKVYVDNANLRYADTYKELFLSMPDLDIDLMRNILPIRGNFADYQSLMTAQNHAYKRVNEMARKKHISLLKERVDARSGRHTLVIERDVEATVAGAWCLAGISAEFRNLNKVTKLPGSRHLDLLEVFSWLLAHTNHPEFSERVEDSETGEERMKPLKGIFLPGVEAEIRKEAKGKTELLSYPCYLIRARKMDPQTGRFGWELTPLFSRMLRADAPIPLVTLCTPDDGY